MASYWMYEPGVLANTTRLWAFQLMMLVVMTRETKDMASLQPSRSSLLRAKGRAVGSLSTCGGAKSTADDPVTGGIIHANLNVVGLVAPDGVLEGGALDGSRGSRRRGFVDWRSVFRHLGRF